MIKIIGRKLFDDISMVEKKTVERVGPYSVLENGFRRFNVWATAEPLFQELSQLKPRKEESVEELAEFIQGDGNACKGGRKKQEKNKKKKPNVFAEPISTETKSPSLQYKQEFPESANAKVKVAESSGRSESVDVKIKDYAIENDNLDLNIKNKRKLDNDTKEEVDIMHLPETAETVDQGAKAVEEETKASGKATNLTKTACHLSSCTALGLHRCSR